MTKDFLIGHYTDTRNITGCSVILCPDDVIASCYISGSAPGSRELALLAPERKIQSIQAVLLTGGSAFGLDAAAGVVRYLEEKGRGYKTQYGVVPIVPAAVIFDLNIGNPLVRPNAENAYSACMQATKKFDLKGSVGAGTGATAGKWAGLENAIKAGLGVAELKQGRSWVRAVSVVNAVGDIMDEKGIVCAGALNHKKKFIAGDDRRLRWKTPDVGFNQNTVLAVILTNIKVNKIAAYQLARRSVSGLARAVIPAMTGFDGDVVFSVSTNDVEFDQEIACEMAAEALRQSILSSVLYATSLGGIPSRSDIL